MSWFSDRSQNQNQSENLSDEQAISRYRYMLRTAPPEAIERAHEEAFAQLTPEQRRLASKELAAVAPISERSLATEDPKSLARLATRSEIRQPGLLERVFGSSRGFGAGVGGSFAGTLLTAVAGSFIGSAVAQSFFADHPSQDDAAGEPHESASADWNQDESNEFYEDTGEFDGGSFDDGGDFV